MLLQSSASNHSQPTNFVEWSPLDALDFKEGEKILQKTLSWSVSREMAGTTRGKEVGATNFSAEMGQNEHEI